MYSIRSSFGAFKMFSFLQMDFSRIIIYYVVFVFFVLCFMFDEQWWWTFSFFFLVFTWFRRFCCITIILSKVHKEQNLWIAYKIIMIICLQIHRSTPNWTNNVGLYNWRCCWFYGIFVSPKQIRVFTVLRSFHPINQIYCGSHEIWAIK